MLTVVAAVAAAVAAVAIVIAIGVAHAAVVVAGAVATAHAAALAAARVEGVRAVEASPSQAPHPVCLHHHHPHLDAILRLRMVGMSHQSHPPAESRCGDSKA